MYKKVSTKEAIDLIPDDSWIAISSFTAISMPEDFVRELECRYLKTGHPYGLSIFHVSGAGNYNEMGLSRLAHEGLLRAVYGSHLAASPKLMPLILENKIESYCIPQGVCSHLTRAMAAREDGLLTKVGLHTYADPRLDGCRMNTRSKEEVVSLVEMNGKEYLYYKTFPLNICLLKASCADKNGNISLEYEPVIVEQLQMAAAVKANGGTVIVQVHEIKEDEIFHPQKIRIPSKFVDYIVVGRTENTFQTHVFPEYHPELNGGAKIAVSELPTTPLNARKICGRRGVFEIHSEDMVNIGGGISETVAAVAAEEGIAEAFQFSVESGVLGGIPVQGAIGIAYNPDVMMPQHECFDLYNGGCLDIAFLGCAQADREGNVNVTRFGNKVVGPGGFVNITQNTKRICFLGTFLSGKSQITTLNGKLVIAKDGHVKKFVNQVEQISFSGKEAIKKGQKIMYITERCVFRLTPEGIMLTEIAPGVRLKQDILDKMDFCPLLDPKLKIMDSRIFCTDKMNLIL